MEDLGLVSEMHRSSRSSRRHGMQPTSANFLPEPLSALLEFIGLMRDQVDIDQGVAMSTGFVGPNPESEDLETVVQRSQSGYLVWGSLS